MKDRQLPVDPHVQVDEVQQLLRLRTKQEHLHASFRKGLELIRLAGLLVDLCARPSRIYLLRRKKTKEVMARLKLALVRGGGACESICRPRLLLAVSVVGLVDLSVGQPLSQQMVLTRKLDIKHHQKTLQMTIKMLLLQRGEEEDLQGKGPLLH